jgi:SAM-dependent methyltransferase
MHSVLLTALAERVICTDIADQNARFGGELIKLVREKFDRNGFSLDCEKLEFQACDATCLPFRDEWFDLIVSFNAMEHIPEPEMALAEMARVVKPGGLVYITFDPIWTADSGSHFLSRLAGASDEECGEFRCAMNRQRLARYQAMLANPPQPLEIVWSASWSGYDDPGHPAHPNHARCLALGYSEEELAARGIALVARRRPRPAVPFRGSANSLD